MSAAGALLGATLGLACVTGARATLRGYRIRRRLAHHVPVGHPTGVSAGLPTGEPAADGSDVRSENDLLGTRPPTHGRQGHHRKGGRHFGDGGLGDVAGTGLAVAPPPGLALAWRSPKPAAAGGAIAAVVVLVWGPGFLLALLLAGTAAAVAWERHRWAAWAQLRRTQLPGGLDRLASALRGGSSVPSALASAGEEVPPPLGPEFAALGREAEGGRAAVEVLDAWANRHPDADTRLVATALVLASVVGAAPARAADGVAATLRERADLAAERRALGAQVRLSGLVLSVAPVGFAGLLAATDSAAAGFLVGSAPGWACLGIGLALDGAGAWWMTQLTRGDDR
jgi:Flp pilus assembly protein TadB